MFNTFHLNKRSVDAGSIAGSLFWAAEDGVDGDSYLGKCFYLDGHTIS
jgi:hypothetical protein